MEGRRRGKWSKNKARSGNLYRAAKICKMAQASTENFERTGSAKQKRVVSAPESEYVTKTPESPLSKGT